MSSTERHLEPDALADLHEGLLTGPAEAAAREHLAGCPACAADLEVLAGMPARLAAAAATEPAPDDVVRRWDDALTDVAAEPAGTAATRTVTPLRSPDRAAPRGMRWLQAAAVVVLLLAGGAVGVSALRDLGGGDAGADNAATDTAGGAAEERAASASFRLTASGRNWTADTVTAAAPDLVAGLPVALGSGPQAPDATEDRAQMYADEPAARLAGGPALADCVTALADGPVTPLAVDLGRYEKSAAAVIILPTPDDPATMDVWVVGPDCAQADAKVLYFARVGRP
jgi:hypothetical protein